MKNLLSSYLLLFSLFLLGCSEEPVSVKTEYDVSGYVISKGVTVENAIVSLAGDDIRKTSTDAKGYFKLVNIAKGNYKLTISKSNASGSFTEDAKYIDVDGDLYLDYLILPNGITVFQPKMISENSLELIWSATDALSFREYKIYQNSTSGLDETTGTLIHVSTSINDTSFAVKDLNPLTNYYFRVYVMNDFGRLGGSNIVEAKTENLEIITNGSFEIINNNSKYPKNWDIYISDLGGTVLVDSSEAINGNYSIYIDGCGSISQIIDPSKLNPGTKYQFSCWIKHDALNTDTYLEEISAGLQNQDYINYWGIGFVNISDGSEASDWKEYKSEFTMPSITASNFELFFGIISPENTSTLVDKMSLIKVE